MTQQARVAVAATGQQALAAGLGVAADGGGAVDAALAAAFVAMATEPGMVSFGGGAFLSIWPVDGEPVVIDGNVEMPGRGSPADAFGAGVREVFTAYGGGVTMHAGAGSVATPGIVPAFAVAHERYARLDWARLLAPATTAAREGYPMSPAAARYLAFTADSLFAEDAEAHALVTASGGELLKGGESTRNQLLAEVLDELAAAGPALFTGGRVGRALVGSMVGTGLITAADLAAYTPVVREPHTQVVGEWTVATNPPPSVGGPVLAVMVGELARRSEGAPWTWADAIEVQRAVLGYRLDVHDLSADLEADGRALLAAVGERGLSALQSPSTAHISAVDADGNACAITMSSGYGAGTCIPGTGILLNNCLGEVELNRRGLHAMAPGTRLASNMAPTTARAADGRALAIGSPGADRITSALMLVLGQGFLHGADLREAIDDPRLHLRRDPDSADGGFVVEHERDDAIAAAVASSGLPSHEYPEPHMYFGGVGAAYRSVTGDLLAAGDSRRAAAVGMA